MHGATCGRVQLLQVVSSAPASRNTCARRMLGEGSVASHSICRQAAPEQARKEGTIYQETLRRLQSSAPCADGGGAPTAALCERHLHTLVSALSTPVCDALSANNQLPLKHTSCASACEAVCVLVTTTVAAATLKYTILKGFYAKSHQGKWVYPERQPVQALGARPQGMHELTH